MSMNVADWEATLPWIDWRTPIELRLMGDPVVHYACRICIATQGLRGAQIRNLPIDPQEVHQHIARAHVQLLGQEKEGEP